ncbi:uncharacterized protein KD926_006691 [Aspergillus affinis]|uniref:uncharacterized protein n=1 Tax=Aspergillus affinis TaxID=1070780 RepID=UPI0022FDB34A|nr:uncharacterized protein KD926_006691 [Aspergillus affinis]KAI9041617.1 hypothetical protein KD926_006691 [Aspergillus affinis]
MSANDEDFLTPRGLLIQDSFVCDGPSFKDFSKAVGASLELPYTQERFEYWSGLSGMGWNAVWPLLCPVCFPICAHDEKLISELHPILDICYTDVQSTVTLGGLNDLTNDPNNEQLRAKVQKLTADRLDGVTALEKKTDDTFGGLKSGTDAVKDSEDRLKAIVNGFNVSQMEQELCDYDPEDYLEQDLAALKYIRTKLREYKGAVRVVITDLTAIGDSIEHLTVPANEIILGHEKAKIIRKWEGLKTDVQDFKDNYLS